jgi:hypothetical protein
MEAGPTTEDAKLAAEDAKLAQRMQDEEGMDFGDMPELFSTRKPKDASAGAASGLKSIGKGVLAGVAGLVAGPVVGAREEGVSGFFKGLGAGILGAVMLPAAGAVVGATQLGRGVFNSADAMSEKRKGKEWDSDEREWVLYNLSDEAERILNMDEKAYIEVRRMLC